MFLVLHQLPLHIDCPLARLLQNTDEPKDPHIDEPDLERGPNRQTTFRGGFHAYREIVRPKYRLLELGGKNRRKRYGQRLEGRPVVGVSPDELLSDYQGWSSRRV